jgi:putative ABC transport system permease protein
MARALTGTPLPTVGRLPRRSAVAVMALAAGAAATVVVAIAGPSGKAPSPTTFDATNGPHVAVSALPGVNLRPLADLPGLTAASGPFTGVDTSLRYAGREVGVRLEGRPAAKSAVDQPLLVSGEWARPGTVVLERSTARALDVPLGGRLTVATTRGRTALTVSGVAETAAPARYPGTGRGLGYVEPGTLAGVGPKATFGSTMLLRLADPDRTGKYLEWIKQRYPGAQVAVEAPSRSH